MLGERVKTLRLLRKMKQEELARLSGVPQPTISSLERGRYKGTNIEIVQALADALNIEVDWLLGREQRFIDKKFPPELAEIVKDFQQLSDESKKFAAEIFRTTVRNFPSAKRARKSGRAATA